MKKVSKPSGACAEKLSRMFPATKSPPLKRPESFDPLEECLALPAQKKKKASRVKPIMVKVIVLPNRESIVPKGKKRQKLLEEKRIESIEMKRTMSPSEVESKIRRTFVHLSLKKWEYLEVDGRHLYTASAQSRGGEIVDRRGALYIRQKQDECQVC